MLFVSQIVACVLMALVVVNLSTGCSVMLH